MPPSQLTLRVPGKLMVAGEYAVLEPHQPSVVAAVDRYMTATIALAPEGCVSLPALGLDAVGWRERPALRGERGWGSVRFEREDPRLNFVGEAIAVALGYVREQFLLPLPFHLTLTSELDDPGGRKYGLGSSAAAVVATVAAVLSLLRDDDMQPVPEELVFQLAAIAHLRAQGGGSGADVAASTFGGFLRYASFQPEWLGERIGRGDSLMDLLAAPWPFYACEKLPLPEDWHLLVGWTGEPASTAGLMPRVRALRDREPNAYAEFLGESREAVEQLVAGFERAESGEAFAGLERNRRALAKLGANAGVPIETPALAKLADLADLCGGAGKLSGAGGGDCGLALVVGDERIESLKAAWAQAGLQPLNLKVAPRGVELVEPSL